MKVLGKNKKAYFDYEILEKFEAGIVLEGWEVKSIKSNTFSLIDSYIKLSNLGAFISNMHVSRWKTQSSSQEINEDKDRKLLLRKDELKKLEAGRRNSGVSIVPLQMYEKANKIKMEIAMARGRRKYDKREAVKRREVDRDIKRVGERW